MTKYKCVAVDHQSMDADYLLNNLSCLGAFLWYKSQKTGSAYIKFKDARLGSIRVADHPSRERYSYKYDLTVPLNQYMVDHVITSVQNHANKLVNPTFEKNQYILYNKNSRTYEEKFFKSFEEFKKAFFNKSQ